MLLAARVARRHGALEPAERLACRVIGMAESWRHRCQAGYVAFGSRASNGRIGVPRLMRPSSPPRRFSGRSARPFESPVAGAPGRCARRRICRWPKIFGAGRSRRSYHVAKPFWSVVHARALLCWRECSVVIRNWPRHPNRSAGIARCGCPCRAHPACFGNHALLARITPSSPRQRETPTGKTWIATLDGELEGRLLLDKNPSIFPMLAGAVRLFPEARVAHRPRDPRDVVWSCFTQALPVNAGTAAFVRLESAAEQVAAELEQWFRLRARLATPWLEVRTSRWFGRPSRRSSACWPFSTSWSPEVLAFHQRRDPVRSPTYAAAVQPMHQGAVGRWRRYAALIEPLETRLDEVIREVGVDVRT